MIGLCLSSLFFESKFLNLFSLKDNFNYVYRTFKTNDDESFLHGVKTLYVFISIPTHLIGLFYVAGLGGYAQCKYKYS